MDKGGAFCASLLFHVLLLLVLASSSSFDIRVGKQSRFDVIFWVSPSSVAAQGRPMLPLEANTSGQAPATAGGVKGVAAADAAAKKTDPPAAARGSQPVARKVPVATPASPPPATARMETPADATLLLPPTAKPAAAPAARPAAALAAALAAAPASVKEQVMGAAAKETAHRAEPERSRPSALPMPVRLGAFIGERLSGGNDSAGSNRTSATVATNRSNSQAVPAATSRIPTTAQQNEESPQGAARAVTGGGSATRPDRATPVKNERVAAEKEPEPRGVMTSSLQGDLKMIISGGNGIRLLVVFREYPKSRRNRPLTRIEARREQRLQPLMAKTDEDTREAVVESARDGIYTFIAEAEHGERGEARFTLKLFERGGKERIAEIGTRSVSGKAVLARVLMRDGILWDDDSAFTGSLEDSESTTKFNANSGLYWKEYH